MKSLIWKATLEWRYYSHDEIVSFQALSSRQAVLVTLNSEGVYTVGRVSEATLEGRESCALLENYSTPNKQGAFEHAHKLVENFNEKDD